MSALLLSVKTLFLGPPQLLLGNWEGELSAQEGLADENRLQNSVLRCLTLLADSGASTHRVERIGVMLCHALGLHDCTVYVLPSLLTLTFNGQSPDKITRTLNSGISPSLSLTRMEALDYYVTQIIEGGIPGRFLDAVVLNVADMPPLFNFWFQLFAGALSNSMVAIAFFNTGWEGFWIAGAIGLVIIGPLNFVGSKVPSFALIVSPTVAVASGFLCRALVVGGLLPRGCLRGTELSCIINNAPGISLAISALELSSQQVVSGTARFVSAMGVSFLLGLGLSFGEELAALFDPFVESPTNPVPACVPLSLWWLFLSFPAVTLAFFVLLDAPLRRWLVMFLCGGLAFWASFGLAKAPLSPGVQTLLASAGVGLFASLYSYFTVLPSR